MTKYTLTRDIVIPAGTVLSRAANERGGPHYLECCIGHGPHFASTMLVKVHPDAIASGDFKEVV